MFSRAAPLLGPPSSAEENQALYGWLGRGLPAFSGLCPIRVGGRLVGALYVDYPDAPSDFAEEAALAALVGSALERVVRERGSGASDEIPSTEATEADALLFGTSTPEQGTTPAVQCEPPPRDTSPSPQEQGLREQDGSPKPLLALEAEPEPWASLADELGATIPIERPDGDEKTRIGDVEALVAQLSSDSLDDVEDATTALIAQGTSALPALKAAFPGRLLHDSFSLRQIPRTAAHLGPLIEVMAALGHEGVTACLPFLDAKDREQRFAATYLFRACPDARAIQFLRHRLNDPEPLVSELAASALAPFVEHPEFRQVLEHYRRRLVGATVEGRTRAAWLLGEFRDVASVPQLIAALRDRAEVANAAHLALTKVTLQDLGFEASGWIAWWKVGKRRCRVEWLLDGLVSPEFDLRELAGRELTLLAGTDHGYHGDDPLPRREEATQQFMHWWERTRESHHDEV
ncbi:MAG: HEAT repeat domain-containing protein, partial [Myxococcota bacterium]